MTILARPLKGEIYAFSPRRTLYHMDRVSPRSVPRKLKSRTARRARRIQVPLKRSVSPSRILERAEIYSVVASGWRPAMSSLRAWMPSKMAISFWSSLSREPRLSLRIWRANSNLGTTTHSPLESLVKVSSSRSISSRRGDS